MALRYRPFRACLLFFALLTSALRAFAQNGPMLSRYSSARDNVLCDARSRSSPMPAAAETIRRFGLAMGHPRPLGSVQPRCV
jgi:hypothetical protein